MSGPNRRFLRSLLVCVVGISSLRLLAQTPLQGSPTSPAMSNEPPSPQIALPQTVPSQTPSPQMPSSQAAIPQSAPMVTNPNVRLGIGDLIDVTVFGVPDLTTRARISGSGEVYLPLIDYVHIADLTTDEAQELIQKRLEDGGFVRSPHVSVYVNESASEAITVLGEVAHPGPLVAVGNRRLFDIISAAGGLTDKAGRNVTIEHRGDPSQKQEVLLSLNLADDDSKSNVDIQPGDTVIVSRAGIVYIVGDVNHPTGFRIQDNSLSVLKCLALAGGQTKTSALSKARILRETPNGIQEIPINLKKVLYAKAPDMAMVKGDILFIPGSALKTAAYRGADVGVSLATTVAVIGVQTF